MAKRHPVCDIRFRQMSQTILWEDTIQAGASWSLRLRRGQELRIDDSEGGANVAALFYNYECLTERYNMPDTLKAQHTAHLTKGFVLYSDMGRILCSITGDTRGWHDPLGGHNDATAVRQKYGDSTYQEMRNAWQRNTRDNFLVELGKYGLGLRDLTPNVNFFSKVVVRNDGSMEYVPSERAAGDFISLRAEMNLLVILDTGQHPLDPNPKYAPKSVKFSVQEALPVAADDLCRVSRPENARGFINTERYFL
jgi:urea carboxylase-associated protein 2